MTVCSYRKNGLISEQTQPGEQTITIQILPNISRSKDNHTMKFGQLIEYNNRILFFKSHAENEGGRLVLDAFLFF